MEKNSNPGNEVRVRFAPVSNRFYSHRLLCSNSRHHGGRIFCGYKILINRGAVENLIKNLSLLDINFDEDPLQGGDYEPYYQSERLDILIRSTVMNCIKGNCLLCF